MAEKGWLLIDSGGSKTHFALTNTDGAMIKEAFCPGIGKSVDNVNEPLDEFTHELKKLCGETEITRAVVNLGGKNEQQLRRILEEALPGADIRIFRESSGVLANAIREKYSADVIILMGTGVIAIGSGPKGSFIADGWGCNIGDAASGYWIGLEAIRRSLIALEAPEMFGSLAREITGRSEPFAPAKDGAALMAMRDEVRGYIGFPLDRAQTAAYAKAVGRHAEAGDPVALAILADAGTALAETAVRTLRMCGQEAEPSVLIIGGASAMAEFWGGTFEARLRRDYPGAVWQALRLDLLEGALAYAQNAEC